MTLGRDGRLGRRFARKAVVSDGARHTLAQEGKEKPVCVPPVCLLRPQAAARRALGRNGVQRISGSRYALVCRAPETRLVLLALSEEVDGLVHGEAS